MDISDDIGPCIDEDLVAALEAWAAEIFRSEISCLDHSAHGAIADEDALLEDVLERLLSV